MIHGMKSLYVLTICPSEDDHPAPTVLPFAISLAQAAEAHLSIETAIMRIVVPSAGTSSAVSGLVSGENHRLAAIAEREAQQAHADARAAGVAATALPVHLSYSDMIERLPQHVRVHDLSIFACGAGLMEAGRGLVEKALFEGARPILIVPPEKSQFNGKRILVAWDGSIMASRAVAGALPLLRAAEQVEVVSVQGEKDLSHAVPGADLARYLAHHSVNVTLKDLVVGKDGVAQTLREQAQMMHADLIVMGSYKHSRLREWILGGVTASMLSECETPILMAH